MKIKQELVISFLMTSLMLIAVPAIPQDTVNLVGNWQVSTIYSIAGISMYEEPAGFLGTIFIGTQEYSEDPLLITKVAFIDEDIVVVYHRDGSTYKGLYEIADLAFFKSPVLYFIKMKMKNEEEYIFAVSEAYDNNRLIASYQLYFFDLNGANKKRSNASDVYCQVEMTKEIE
jgi:hypothetical protein